MSKIGKQIQELRKMRRITQEELGHAVGVTTQAVSKWENGGTPDAELLPAIADFFHVHIDDLFGRATDPDMPTTKYVYQRLQQLTEQERIWEAYRIIHATMSACSNIKEIANILESEELKMYHNGDIKFGFQVTSDLMLGFMSLVDQKPFCFFLPEPKNGFTSSLIDIQEYQNLFVFLSKPGVLQVLIQLYQFTPHTGFTISKVAKQCKLKEEVVSEIISAMVQKQWIQQMAVDTGESTWDAYILNENASLVPFLMLAEEMIHPTNVGYCIALREKPILSHKQQEHDKTTR